MAEYLDKTGLAYFWSKIKALVPNKSKKTEGIFYGELDSTSTSTVMTAQIEGIDEYRNGIAILLKNGVVTSASGWTLNINSLGAKPVYSSMAAATRVTTHYNINYTWLFVYDENRIQDGCWVAYYGYYSDANTIGYILRTNYATMPTTSAMYRYRLMFTSMDGEHYIPANSSTLTNATGYRDPTQTPFNPFGRIVYYGTTAAVAEGGSPAATSITDQTTINIGYSFSKGPDTIPLTLWKPVYLICTPQSNGSAIIDPTTTYTQSLPSTENGKIYIFLGIAYSETNLELMINHPIYYFKHGRIRIWNDSIFDNDLILDCGTSTEVTYGTS